jgi:hypothetical protein
MNNDRGTKVSAARLASTLERRELARRVEPIAEEVREKKKKRKKKKKKKK